MRLLELDTDGLRKLTRAYTRECRVVDEVRRFQFKPSGEAWRQIESLEIHDDQRLSAEAILYVLRSHVASGDLQSAWLVAESLIRRCGAYVHRKMQLWRPLGRDDAEDIRQELNLALFSEWFSLGPAEEFWEVRFWVCLERTLSTVMRRSERVEAHERELSPIEDAEGDSQDPWDSIKDESVPDFQQLAEARAALAAIPETYRRVYYLHKVEQWTETQIGKSIGRTERTVRTYIRKAEEHVISWRNNGSEGRE